MQFQSWLLFQGEEHSNEARRSKRQLAAEVAATQPHITYTTHVHFFPTQSGITRLRRRVEHQSRKIEDFPTTTTNSSHEIEVINIETILSRLGSTFSLEVELMLDSFFKRFCSILQSLFGVHQHFRGTKPARGAFLHQKELPCRMLSFCMSAYSRNCQQH